MLRKQCVRTAIVNPDASEVERILSDEFDAYPTPAAAPHTINTNKNDAKHSEIIALILGKIIKINFNLLYLKNYSNYLQNVNIRSSVCILILRLNCTTDFC